VRAKDFVICSGEHLKLSDQPHFGLRFSLMDFIDLPHHINSKVVMYVDDPQILASYQLDDQ